MMRLQNGKTDPHKEKDDEMSKPEETAPTTPAPERELTELEKFLAQPMPTFEPSPYGPNARPKVRRRKALRIEVSPRTYEAVKANPSDLKLIAKDAHGNTVIERPARRRMTEAEMAERNQRLFAERRAEAQANQRRADPGPSAPDQRWTPQRTWSGEVRYRPDNRGSNPFVTHVYDVFDVLKEDER
jgi:hypothetical protein